MRFFKRNPTSAPAIKSDPYHLGVKHGKVRAIGLFIVVVLTSIFFGLLATTANPVLVGMGAGLIVGPALLLVPELTIWIILIIGLLMGVLSASPQFGKVTWIVSIFSLLLILPSLVNMAWSKERHAPTFIKIALIFMVYAVLVTFIQWHSFGEFLAGFKRYFQAFGLMLALTLLVFLPASYARWRKFLLVVALLQMPFALYELLVLVPKRGGISLSSETTDVIAGTFGANLLGGSPNSVMVTYIFITLSFLAARWRAKLISHAFFFSMAFVCLLPLGMGESKIAVVMLPLAGLILLRKEMRESTLKYILALMGLTIVTLVLGYIYITVLMDSSLYEVIELTLRYNVGDQGYSKRQLLNRLTSITFWFKEQHLYDPASFLIGNGLGSSYTSLTSMGGHIGAKYPYYGINLTAASTLLWDTGVIGFVMFLSIFVSAWNAAGRLYRLTSEAAVKADALAIQTSIALLALSIIYSDFIVNLVSMELIYALVLGYLGYLLNLHGDKKRASHLPKAIQHAA
jgi:hypothetical protein